MPDRLSCTTVTSGAFQSSKLRHDEAHMHAAANSLLARAVGLTPIGRAYARAAAGDPAVDFSARALRILDIDVVVPREALDHVPRTGPVIVVANHPFGALDGLVILTLMRRVRSDMRLLANRWLDHLPELRDCLVPVDVFGRPADAVRRNSTALRSAMHWLERGGCLGMFPAGEVAHHETPAGRVIDSPWRHTAAELALDRAIIGDQFILLEKQPEHEP